MLTPLHTDVSKLSKFNTGNVLNGSTREQVVTTASIFNESNQQPTELAQLAQLSYVGGERVRFRADATDEEAVIRAMVQELAGLTAQELAAYRQELAAAPPDDPHLRIDRQALAVFEAMRAGRASA